MQPRIIKGTSESDNTSVDKASDDTSCPENNAQLSIPNFACCVRLLTSFINKAYDEIRKSYQFNHIIIVWHEYGIFGNTSDNTIPEMLTQEQKSIFYSKILDLLNGKDNITIIAGTVLYLRDMRDKQPYQICHLNVMSCPPEFSENIPPYERDMANKISWVYADRYIFIHPHTDRAAISERAIMLFGHIVLVYNSCTKVWSIFGKKSDGQVVKNENIASDTELGNILNGKNVTQANLQKETIFKAAMLYLGHIGRSDDRRWKYVISSYDRVLNRGVMNDEASRYIEETIGTKRNIHPCFSFDSFGGTFPLQKALIELDSSYSGHAVSGKIGYADKALSKYDKADNLVTSKFPFNTRENFDQAKKHAKHILSSNQILAQEKCYRLKNACYIFTRSLETTTVFKQEKISPNSEEVAMKPPKSFGDVDDDLIFFQPGYATNLVPFDSDGHTLAIEICADHISGVLRKQNEKSLPPPNIQFVISDSVEILHAHIMADFCILSDSLKSGFFAKRPLPSLEFKALGFDFEKLNDGDKFSITSRSFQ